MSDTDKPLRIVLAPTDAVDALEPYVDRVLKAIARVCDEPGFAHALVTDESWFSDFMISEPEEYEALSRELGIGIDPRIDPDAHVIYRVAARLRQRGEA